MKQCPHCKAALSDEANYCLYCMTPLSEKEQAFSKIRKSKRRIYVSVISAAFLLCICTFICIVFFQKNKDTSPNEKFPINQSSDTNNTTEEIAIKFTADIQAQTEEKNTTNTVIKGNDGKTSETINKPEDNTPPITENITNDTVKKTEDNTPAGTEPTQSTASSVKYIYRNVQQGDDCLRLSSEQMKNRIVIIGVENAAKDGVYIIPETIDGKKVFAIVENAFSDSKIAPTVKKVYLPKYVWCVRKNAFSGCVNLSDIYFAATDIYVFDKAFPEESARNCTLTIHCMQNCTDRAGHYYSEVAEEFGAKYEEWNP